MELLVERNSNSSLRVLSFSDWGFGLIEMKLFSSRKSAEKEIRGLGVGSAGWERVSWETMCEGVWLLGKFDEIWVMGCVSITYA